MRHKDKYASPYSKPQRQPRPAKLRVVEPRAESTAIVPLRDWHTGSTNWMVFDELDWGNAWFDAPSTTERTIHRMAMSLIDKQEQRRQVELQEHRDREAAKSLERRYGGVAW